GYLRNDVRVPLPAIRGSAGEHLVVPIGVGVEPAGGAVAVRQAGHRGDRCERAMGVVTRQRGDAGRFGRPAPAVTVEVDEAEHDGGVLVLVAVGVVPARDAGGRRAGAGDRVQLGRKLVGGAGDDGDRLRGAPDAVEFGRN